jgi:hypothetical protein
MNVLRRPSYLQHDHATHKNCNNIAGWREVGHVAGSSRECQGGAVVVVEVGLGCALEVRALGRADEHDIVDFVAA